MTRNEPATASGAERAVAAFTQRFHYSPAVLVRAPARVQLLGGHIDYSEGWVLAGAIDRALWLAAGPGRHQQLRLWADDLGEQATIDLRQLPPPVPQRPAPTATWWDYVGGLAWTLAEQGHEAPASDLVIASDIPIGAGISSSAALEMAVLLAWQQLQGSSPATRLDRGSRGGWCETPILLRPAITSRLRGIRSPVTVNVSTDTPPVTGFASDRTDVTFLRPSRRSEFNTSHLAVLGQRCENTYLGVQSGIMDQYTCLLGRRDHAVLLDCRRLEHQLVPMAGQLAILVADSGVRRRLVSCGYSDRRQECRQAVALLRHHLPGIRTLRDVSEAELDRLQGQLPSPLDRRARHAVTECQRVRRGAESLRQGDLAAFGELMQLSHHSSRDLYEVSLPELDLLAETAAGAPGCYGARLSGGGFGGCVVALCEQAAVATVAETVIAAFLDRFSRRPALLGCCLADGAAVEQAAGIG